MDLQTLLIALVKGNLQDIASRISEKDINIMVNQINKQLKVYTKITGMTNSIPYLNRYNTIKDVLEHELNKRKGL
jgi:hypothetical protein